MTAKPMVVNGLVVPERAREALLERMHSGETFQCRDLIDLARKRWPSATSETQMRLADRLIQVESKAGRITKVDGRAWQASTEVQRGP